MPGHNSQSKRFIEERHIFQHDTKLEPPLSPSDYVSDDAFRREQAMVFDREWHFAGLTTQIPRAGDYLSVEAHGVPVVVRNAGGGIRAFVNICAHRHCAVVPVGAGHGDTLRCQYHGWEYGDDGKIAKITDGVSFKGIRAKEFQLEPCRLETLGSLIFVSFHAETKSLRESLGEMAAELDHFFGNHRQIWRWVSDYPVNWKIVVENAVESYHVPMIHPGTFMDYKREEHHEHTLRPAFTSYLDTAPMGTSITDRGFQAFTRMTAPKVHFERAKHIHIFPNHLIEVREVYSLFSTVEPLGPQQTRFTSLGFLPRDIKFPLLMRPLQYLFGVALTTMAKRIMGEDTGIWSEVQRGLDHSRYAGVLSRREERVYAFQRYLSDAMGTQP
ncbi:MAG: aromatic ring-hydroxylating dioxygenase subunit alpha [Thermoanaerobaculia bacterium]